MPRPQNDIIVARRARGSVPIGKFERLGTSFHFYMGVPQVRESLKYFHIGVSAS